MKLLFFTAFVGISASVNAKPHIHRHRHLRDSIGRRQDFSETIYEPGPVETVTVWMLNGQAISEDEVRQGIDNGTLVWDEDGNLSSSAASSPTPAPISIATASKEPAPTSESTQAPVAPTESIAVQAQVLSSEAPSSSAAPEPSKTPEPQTSQAPETQSSQAPAPSNSQSSDGNDDDGVDQEFPNNVFDCSSIPDGYGALAVGHAGLGGWIGIQAPQVDSADGYNDITTVPQGSCSGANCCQPGSFCSYSCPNGYLKSSWPAKQGATGQSVGGLYCNSNGRLEMADGSVAKTLCVKGTDKVTIKVQNNLSTNESICRTDYPGTESETVPVTTQPGETVELACPDNSMYYQWQGKPTSAQYYVNNKGVAEQDACSWGDGSKPVGNWAPVNLGVGYDAKSQRAYLSLAPNAPTNPDAKLDFNIEFKADDMSNQCKYSNGQYLSGSNYDQPQKDGCTVSVVCVERVDPRC